MTLYIIINLMEAKRMCKVCGNPLKAFSSQPDWVSRKMHQKCQNAVREHYCLKDYVDRMNALYGTDVKYPEYPTLKFEEKNKK